MPESADSSRLASFALAVGVGSVVLAALGVVGIQLGFLSPFLGFRMFGLGAVLGGLVTVVLGAVGLFLTRSGSDPAGQKRAATGAGIGLVLLAGSLASAGDGLGYPPINDITTDPVDPPEFVAAIRDPGNEGRDMSFPAEFVPYMEDDYAELRGVRLAVPPAQALARSAAAAESLGWTITRRDEAAGALEATDESALFRFVDDVVVRVRPAGDGEGDGSVVDVRSKSRVGQGDLGANAERILAFFAELQQS